VREIIFGDRSQYKAREDGSLFTRTKAGSHSGGMSNKWRPLKPTASKHGYLYFRINGRRGKNTYVHRVIASLFLGEHPSTVDVNHKNGNKSDNRVDNLEWVTRRENIQHAIRTGLIKQAGSLSTEQVRLIRELLAKGMRPIDIHRAEGFPCHVIYKISEGLTYKRVS
jgi:hypothetical protein